MDVRLILSCFKFLAFSAGLRPPGAATLAAMRAVESRFGLAKNTYFAPELVDELRFLLSRALSGTLATASMF